MQAVLRDHLPIRIVLSQIPLAKGIVWGLLGGLVATLVMDLILMSVLVVAGLSALSCSPARPGAERGFQRSQLTTPVSVTWTCCASGRLTVSVRVGSG